MQAINILRNHICDLEKMILVFDGYAMYKSRDESKKAIQELTEIIDELEAYITNYQGIKRRLDNTVTALSVLGHQNKTLIKTLEKYNEEMIDLRKENQDLKSRSCITCKYGHTYQFDEDIECMKLGADTQGLYFEKDFYCKNWELKNERD